MVNVVAMLLQRCCGIVAVLLQWLLYMLCRKEDGVLRVMEIDQVKRFSAHFDVIPEFFVDQIRSGKVFLQVFFYFC